MSSLRASERLAAATSKGVQADALLVLEDGTTFRGKSCGASGTRFGEICFNTSMVGYLEVMSDPSYAGQIVTMTYPQIGNYGVDPDDTQRNVPHLSGLVVRDLCRTPSSWRSRCTLPEYLVECGVVCIEGIDTRALVRHVRERGAMQAALSTDILDEQALLGELARAECLIGTNHVQRVSCSEPFSFEGLPTGRSFAQAEPLEARRTVVAYDCGAKDSILESLVRAGCDVMVVPWDADADEVLGMGPDGVFLSNGPGDPDAVAGTYDQVERLLGKVPLFGICLGHQMLSKAAGASIEKLKYGHRGGNHPVMNLITGRVEITAQNHGFGQVFSSLGPLVAELSDDVLEHPRDLREWARRRVAPVVENERFGRIRLTHVNLNDGTPEGMQFLDVPAFSVQYHPEASPGSTDSSYLFASFMRLMDGDRDCLAIDIARARLDGWRFSSEKEAAHA